MNILLARYDTSASQHRKDWLRSAFYFQLKAIASPGSPDDGFFVGMDIASVIEASEGNPVKDAFLVAISPDLFAEFGLKKME